MTPLHWIGLILMLLSLTVTIIVLLYDAYRKWVLHIPTISRGIWDDLTRWQAGQGPFPWRAIWLIAGMALMPIGLAIHFFA